MSIKPRSCQMHNAHANLLYVAADRSTQSALQRLTAPLIADANDHSARQYPQFREPRFRHSER